MSRPLAKLINGFRVTQILHAAAKFEIADHLYDGSLPLRELSGRCGCDEPLLLRLLHALQDLEIVSIQEDRIALEPLGRELSEKAEQSLKNYASLCGEDWWWQANGGLFEALRSGRTYFEDKKNTTFFEFLDANPAAADQFFRISRGGSEAKAAADAVDLSGCKVLCDLGGASHITLAAFYRKAAEANLILFDTPAMIGRAREALHKADLSTVITCVHGDLFDPRTIPVLEGGGIYILKYVLHDWDDRQSVKILGNIAACMAPQDRILVIEQVIWNGNASASAPGMVDMGMVMLTGGKCRTPEEFSALAAEAGLKVADIKPTETAVSVVELCR